MTVYAVYVAVWSVAAVLSCAVLPVTHPVQISSVFFPHSLTHSLMRSPVEKASAGRRGVDPATCATRTWDLEELGWPSPPCKRVSSGVFRNWKTKTNTGEVSPRGVIKQWRQILFAGNKHIQKDNKTHLSVTTNTFVSTYACFPKHQKKNINVEKGSVWHGRSQ